MDTTSKLLLLANAALVRFNEAKRLDTPNAVCASQRDVDPLVDGLILALGEVERLRAAIAELAANVTLRASDFNDDSDAACRETGKELEDVASTLRAMVKQ